MLQSNGSSQFFKSNLSSILYAYADEISPEEWDSQTPLHFIRPVTGMAANIWTYEDLKKKFHSIGEKEAKILWDEALSRAEITCIHGPQCRLPNCEAGKTSQTIHIVTGQFVVLWGYLQECIPKEKKLRLVQVEVEIDPEMEALMKDMEIEEEGKKGKKKEEEKKEKESMEMEEEKEEGENDDDDEKKKKTTLLITGVRILGAMSDELKAKLHSLESIQRVEGSSFSNIFNYSFALSRFPFTVIAHL